MRPAAVFGRPRFRGSIRCRLTTGLTRRRVSAADPTVVRVRTSATGQSASGPPFRRKHFAEPGGPSRTTHVRRVVYFSFVIDVFSRMIVGWQLASHMRTDLVLDALRMALGLRDPGADFELVAHTDAGSQPGLNRPSQQCVGDWTVRDAGNAAVVA